MVTTAAVALLVGLLLGLVAGIWIAARTRSHDARAGDPALVEAGLRRLAEQVDGLTSQRTAWQAQLAQQVDDVRRSSDSLRSETAALTTALRRPAVRGQWGELQLRRTVELAGLQRHADFSEQTHLAGTDGDAALRPDLVVHLAGGKSIVVDAKAPMAAYLDSLAAGSEHPEEQPDMLRAHARQLRAHVDTLAGKAYWRRLDSTPEFVVLFVPAESVLSAALEADPTLIEYAAARKVMLASPTTLIAMLRTVAHAWTTQTLAERTREIHELGRQLYERLGILGGHLDRLGRSLSAATDAYNRTVGSLESRVLVTARQFEDVGLTGADATGPDGAADQRVSHLPAPAPVSGTPRRLTARELLDVVSPEAGLWPADDVARTADPTHGDPSGGAPDDAASRTGTA